MSGLEFKVRGVVEGCGYVGCRDGLDRYALPVFVEGRRLGLGTMAAVLALGLAGCGGGSDKPRSLPPLSTPTSTTPSTSPSQNPKAAAMDAVRAYFHARNQLATDVEAVALQAVTTTDCACRALVRSARKLASEHRHYFGRAVITQMLPSTASATQVQLLVRYDSTAGGVRDDQGQVVSRDPAHHGVKQLFLVKLTAGKWRVAGIVLIKSGT